MAQGKLKSKAKLPKNVQDKRNSKKGGSVTKRANKPVKSKKKGITEAQKLKQAVHKTVSKAVEEEIRSIAANETNKTLSKAQQAVAAHHKKGNSGPT